MIHLLLGLVKGAIVGGGIGYGAYALEMTGGWNWITYGVVGAMVGLLVGRPLWRHLLDKGSTAVTSILKAVFGFGVACGLYALIAKVWGGFDLTLAEESRNVINWQFITGGAIGAVYGAFVEFDDAIGQADEAKKQGKLKA